MSLPSSPTVPPQPLNLSYQAALPTVTPTAPASPLSADVQGKMGAFWSHLQAASSAYNALSERYKALWENTALPMEHRRLQAAQLLTEAFTTVDAELSAAQGNLQAARDMVRKGLTPPLLGSADVHELKLMNAREEVRSALEGLQPNEQRRALVTLFEEEMQGGSVTAIAYFIAATDAYKRLLKDPATRAAFAYDQPAMLRRLLPPSAAPYLTAGAELDKAQEALQTAQTVRYFTAKDNGLRP